LPGQTTQRLYDIDPLVPLVEAGYHLLTPNIRLARRIKVEWDRRQAALGQKVWRPAPVHPLESWLEARWRRARRAEGVPARSLLDRAGEKEIWLDVIERDRQHTAEYSLLQPESAADIAALARDNLLRWQVDTRLPAVHSAFQLDADCGTFLRWLEAFDQRLEDEGFGTLADCIGDLLRGPCDEEQPCVALLDFDELSPLYRACLQAHASDVLDIRSPGTPGDTEVVAFLDKAAELQAVAAWAAGLHRAEPASTVGVVLVDMQADQAPLEYELRREFSCLGDDYNSLPVNFSAGITLDRAPVIRDALRMLQSNCRQMLLRDVLGLLQSRFSLATEGDSDLLVAFLQELYREGREVVDTGHLRTRAARVQLGEQQGLEFGRSLYRVFELRLSNRSLVPSEWVVEWGRVLDCFGWPGPGPLDSLEYQQVDAWYQALDQFAGYDRLHGPLGLEAALDALLRCCQSRVSHPQTADSNLQVLGPLEAAGLQFDFLWLCGAQGGRWPAAARPNPFIPIAIQLRSGMPHASSQREWEFASSLMTQYRNSAQHLVTSYCTQLDGVPELPGALLAGLPVRESGEQARLPEAWLQQRRHCQLESLEDSSAPPVGPGELAALRGGSGIFEDQANCPFRAFARRRLSLDPLGDYRTALSPGERGELLHAALFALWGRIENSAALVHLDEQAASAEAAATAIESVPATLRELVGTHCLELERQRLESLLLEWLSVEKQRAPFVVQAREDVLEAAMHGIPLRLRIDRVDALEDGGHLIIDYKSGRNSLADWLGERPARPQLPLYGILGENVAGVAYAQVRSRECRFLGLGDVAGVSGVRQDIGSAVKRHSVADSWEALQAEWRANLDRLALRFLAGDAAVDPLPRACDYCGLQALCRVAVPHEEGR
jgi:probable DNA repair protein